MSLPWRLPATALPESTFRLACCPPTAPHTFHLQSDQCPPSAVADCALFARQLARAVCYFPEHWPVQLGLHCFPDLFPHSFPLSAPNLHKLLYTSETLCFDLG